LEALAIVQAGRSSLPARRAI